MKRRFFVGALAALAVVAIAQQPGQMREQYEAKDLKQITLERTPCFGACPVYKVTLTPDGKVRYEGKRFVEKLGVYEGEVTPEAVAKACVTIDKLGFWKMKDNYTALITDMPSALVMVDKGGKSKMTNNYADQGPAELWAIEQLIDKVVLDVREWKKVD